jgi:hypothetical protein
MSAPYLKNNEAAKPKFRSVANALHEECLVVAREVMIRLLLERGIDYTDFHIVERRYPKLSFGLYLRTVREPMPPELYDPVMEVFEMLGAEPSYGFANTSAVMLASEATGWVPVDPRVAESDQSFGVRCGFLFEQIKSLTGEIAAWQADSDDETMYICWPAVARNDLNRTCIVISMIDRHFPYTREGSNNYERLRGFIRTLPEYRRHCVFHANWTPVPPQTGQSFQRKLDTRSKPNWTPVPGQTGHLGRNGAGLRCGFTPYEANLSN